MQSSQMTPWFLPDTWSCVLLRQGNTGIHPKRKFHIPHTHTARIINMGIHANLLVWRKKPVLHFNTPISATKVLRCAHCKTEIRPNQDAARAILSVRRKTVRLAVQLSMKELLSISWLPKELSLQSPKIYEVLTFNFKNGHSFMSLENANGDRYAIRDVSNRDLEADQMDSLYRFFKQARLCI